MPASGPRVRDAIGGLAPYRPGRRPLAGRAMLRLASNESPFPPSAAVRDAVSAAAATGHRYPDPSCGPLVATLAARHGVPAEQIAVGNGSVQLLQELLLATCGPGDEVVFPWRSFEAYPVLTTLTGATPVQVPLRADLSADVDEILAHVTERTRAVLLCSPNNPTGGTVAQREVEHLLSAIPGDVLVVVDEAYREFVTDRDAVDGLALAQRFPNVVTLRTFSKAYGLAGLRVGFAVAGSAGFVEVLARMHLPFSVSQLAQDAAIAALGDLDHNERQVAAVLQTREELLQALRDQGWEVPQAQGNFVWLATPDATAVSRALVEQGVLSRCFPGEGVRITVPAAQDLNQLTRACGARVTVHG